VPASLTPKRQRAQLDLLAQLNRNALAESPIESELNARIESFELAYRMQTAAPEAFDVKNEPEHIQKLYGLNEKHCGHFAAQCLTARRMVERGVRFIQIYSGGMENQQSWDGHNDIAGNHRGFALESDQPVAALPLWMWSPSTARVASEATTARRKGLACSPSTTSMVRW
jgi:hypothetical protein